MYIARHGSVIKLSFGYFFKFYATYVNKNGQLTINMTQACVCLCQNLSQQCNEKAINMHNNSLC